MQTVNLSILGKQHYAMPGNPVMEQLLREECGDSYHDLQREVEAMGGRVELLPEEDLPEEYEADDELRLIGQLVGKIMETAHGLAPETDFFTVASFSEEEEGISLSFEETSLTGMEGVNTTLRVSRDGVVTLCRSGKVATNLVFEKEKRWMCLFERYMTPGMPVSIYTRDLSVKRRGNFGYVHIDYFIEVGGVKTEHDEFFIRWKPHKD